MAKNHTIRLLASLLLAGLASPVFSAQETYDPTTGGSPGAARGAATASPPATLPEAPPKAPKVTCDDGHLRISADNSTLGSILSAVRACTGVQIDVPEKAGAERVFEDLGPGPQREVLEELLNGSDFNYVIGASDADPEKVETILLMDRKTELAANDIPAGRELTPARRAWLERHQIYKLAGTSGETTPSADDSSTDTTTPEDVSSAPAPADNAGADGAAQTPAPAPVPTPAASTDSPAPAADPSAQPAPQENVVVPEAATSPAPTSENGNNPALDSGKSTSERIADMQQMFEQRKQMVQNPGSTTSQPQP